MKESLCKTCARNTSKFPLVLCRKEPYNEEVDDYYDCDDYCVEDEPYISIRFIFPDGGHKDYVNLIECPIIHGVKQNSLRPVKVIVSTGGIFNKVQKNTLQQLFYKQVSKALHPTQREVVFCGNAEKLLTL